MNVIRKVLFFIIISFGILQARYTTLDDALKNGVSRGDAILYGNYTNNSNANFISGSVGLGYTSGFYYDLRAAISFRASKIFYNSVAGLKDFYTDPLVSLGQSFVEYYDGDTAIKAGRFLPISPFINYLVDGIWVRNGSIEGVVIDTLWAKKFGRVSFYEITPFLDTNRYGYFDINAKFFFTRTMSDYKNSAFINLYTFFEPNSFIAFGGRWHSAFRFNNSSIWTGLDAGAGYSAEYKVGNTQLNKNSYLIDAKLGFGMSIFDIFLGYVGSGENGFGSFDRLGMGNNPYGSNAYNILPFFTWGGIAPRGLSNANLFYGSVEFNLLSDRLKMYLTYGSTIYGIGKKGVQNEINFLIDSFITNNISLILMVTNTHLSNMIPNYTRINGGIRLSF